MKKHFLIFLANLFMAFSLCGQDTNKVIYLKNDSNCVIMIINPKIERLPITINGVKHKTGAISRENIPIRKMQNGTITIYNKYYVLESLTEYKNWIMTRYVEYESNGDTRHENNYFIEDSIGFYKTFWNGKLHSETYENKKQKFQRYTEWFENGVKKFESFEQDSIIKTMEWDEKGNYIDGNITIYNCEVYRSPLYVNPIPVWIRKIKIDEDGDNVGDWIFNNDFKK